MLLNRTFGFAGSFRMALSRLARAVLTPPREAWIDPKSRLMSCSVPVVATTLQQLVAASSRHVVRNISSVTHGRAFGGKARPRSHSHLGGEQREMNNGQSSIIHQQVIGSEGRCLQDKARRPTNLVAAKRRLSKRQSDIQDEQRAWFLSEKIRWTRTCSQKVTQRGNRPSGRPSGRWANAMGRHQARRQKWTVM